jgi:hypothetical protein
MELSKNVQKGGKNNSKTTDINHLIKEDVEHGFDSNLAEDLNSDLLVVNIHGSVGTKSAPPTHVDDEDDDGYWSDFSDDEYTQEVKEEKNAKEVLTSLQRWAYNSNIEKELTRKYKSKIITLEQFKNALYDAGYH